VVELFVDLGQDLARRRARELVRRGGAAVQRRALLQNLDLARAQADADLDTPDLADGRDAIALGALARGQHNLLGALNLVALKQPRSGALDEVALVRPRHPLEQGRDLGLRQRLGRDGLGLFLVGTRGEQAGREEQAQEQLVGKVGGERQVGLAARHRLRRGIGGAGKDGVADNGAKQVDLGAELDLDGLALLDLDGGLGLVALEGGVGRDERRARDGDGVGRAWRLFFSRAQGRQAVRQHPAPRPHIPLATFLPRYTFSTSSSMSLSPCSQSSTILAPGTQSAATWASTFSAI
jgi:hypothetical protein